MPDNQDDQETEDDRNIKTNAELRLQYLLMLNANPDEKEKVVQHIARKTGNIPENVERVLQATLELMFKITRGN
jgi:hypothetical protein